MRNGLQLSLFFLLFFSIQHLAAQSGCTDPQANNYDANATINDGSCTYPSTSYDLSVKSKLSPFLNENSGLISVDGNIWTHEDSGGDHAIYQVNPENGQILKSVQFLGATNIAWEDIASDGTHIYVGDFGNNDGSRQDLVIYKINKNDIGSDSSSMVASEAIYFSFEDQVDFTPKNFNTPFDCGAFFHFNDSLHIFTHDWVNKSTVHYVLPDAPGTYSAKRKETLNAGLQIAGADINPSGNEAILVGFNISFTDPNVYMWMLSDFRESSFFSGNKRKIKLGAFTSKGQVEGVAYLEDHKGYMSCELLQETFPPINIDANLYAFSTEDFVSAPTNISTQLEKPVSVYPNPATKEVFVQAKTASTYHLYNLIGQELRSGSILPNTPTRLELQTLRRGMYLLKISGNGKNHTTRLVLK